MQTATRKRKPRQLLTPEQKRFIEANYRKYGPAECARMSGATYNACTGHANRMGVNFYKRNGGAPVEQPTPIADADRLLNAKPSDGVIIMPRTAHEHRAAAKWSEARAEDMQPAGYEKSDVQGIKWTAIGLGILALTLAVLYADLRGWL
jgi:hypothetical protein